MSLQYVGNVLGVVKVGFPQRGLSYRCNKGPLKGVGEHYEVCRKASCHEREGLPK